MIPSCGGFLTKITSIPDLPNDQGGQVCITFNAALFDFLNEPTQSYDIMRLDYSSKNSSEWVMIAFFYSEPMMGYSVDNILPGVLEALWLW